IVRSSPRLRAGRGLPTAGEVYVRFPHCTRRTRNPGDLRRPRRPLLHSRAMAHVTFLGACGTVTGSATLLTWGERNILLDCGMYQGPDDIEQRNWESFPFPPAQLDAVLVTHAHLDHTGLLPRLAAQGFDGPIYCTKPSRGLIALILEDAGALQEEQASYARRKGYSRHADPQPLYTQADAKRALQLLEPRPMGAEIELAPGITARSLRAGHL